GAGSADAPRGGAPAPAAPHRGPRRPGLPRLARRTDHRGRYPGAVAGCRAYRDLGPAPDPPAARPDRGTRPGRSGSARAVAGPAPGPAALTVGFRACAVRPAA